MKKILTGLIVVLILLLSGCTNNPEKSNENITPNPPLTKDSDILVAYFSWSSSENTKTMAEYISEETKGELFRIYPKTPYTSNYNDVLGVAQEEKNNDVRPALAEDIDTETFENYDIIFLGYPIWWYDAPMIIYTFLEGHDFSNKTIIPFATSGGSGLNEENKFKEITTATVFDGLCIPNFNASDNTKSKVIEWIASLGLTNNDETDSISETKMKMTFEEKIITINLIDNSATRDLINRLKEGNIILSFSDFAGSEKIAYPNPPLDLSDTEGYDPQVGDLMIYKPWNNLCAFYKDSAGYSSSLTLVGHIENNGIELLASMTNDFVATLSLV